MEGERLLPAVAAYGGTPIRWWVLWQVSFLSFNQSLFWITFSPIADPTMKVIYAASFLFIIASQHKKKSLQALGPLGIHRIFCMCAALPHVMYDWGVSEQHGGLPTSSTTSGHLSRAKLLHRMVLY